MDVSRLQALRDASGGTSAVALRPANARQSKRVFVYNLPSKTTSDSLIAFFNAQMNGLNIVKNENPCASAKLSKDNSFGMVEFKTAEEATVALAFNGMTVNESEDTDMENGYANGGSHALEVRRPHNFIFGPPANDGRINGASNTHIPDSPNKLLISNLPVALADNEIAEILRAFGELKAFVLAKDADMDQPRGFAFVEYENPGATDGAVEGLNGLPLGDILMKAQRACEGLQQGADQDMTTQTMSMLAGSNTNSMKPTSVVELLNMVTAKDLMDKNDFQGESYSVTSPTSLLTLLADVFDEVKEECGKYGQIVEMKLPRPAGARQNYGVGKIFIKYDSVDTAQTAARALAGRIFNNRTVVVTYFDEESFEVESW